VGKMCGSNKMLPHFSLSIFFFSQEYKKDNVKKQHGEGITEGAFISTIMVLFLLSII
jgi:hypothetical protein